MQQGDGITFATKNKKENSHLGYNLVNSHAYSATSRTTDIHGRSFVHLNNPWGNHQPMAIPYNALQGQFGEIAVN